MFFSLSNRLESIAKTMINESLPIKCLEAVILAVYAYFSLLRSNLVI